MANVLLAIPMLDKQSGEYMRNSLKNLGHKVACFDWRMITNKVGVDRMNASLITNVETLKPDITIVVKGLGISAQTIKQLKKVQKNPVVCWIFDVTLGGTYVKDVPQYIEIIKEYDTFYTMDNDAVTELKELGVNAKYLTEGCSIPAHQELPIDDTQKRLYGHDIVFIGSVGMIHPNREQYLKAIYDAGYDLKIYGEIYYNDIPEWVEKCHTGKSVINREHSLICQSAKIVIGIDGWTHRSKSMSARIYRTMACGGFYLTTATKDIDKVFKVGKQLDIYKDNKELTDKIRYWLDNDKERLKVAKAGQKKVLAEDTFDNRLKNIMEDN